MRTLKHIFRFFYLIAGLLFLPLHHLVDGAFHPVGNWPESAERKICIGTNRRSSAPLDRKHHYRNLRERYTNCSYVDGNLELTWIEDENLDLSFLQNIQEVTGYVLISRVDARRVVLPKLQIIRGQTLLKLNSHRQKFGLVISMCNADTIEMPALRDILAGGVGLFHNFNVCHIQTINWKEIITGHNNYDVFMYNTLSLERKCKLCHKSCPGGCWGKGPENCQKISKLNCSPHCSGGRCFGPNPRECCHLFCAGGCTGPKQTDCLACRNFYNDGECTQQCPPIQTYNPSTYSWEHNPRGKYVYGATCVKNCPEHLLKDNGACVRSCPPQKTPLNGECVNCEGACPKTCKGVEADGIIHAGNIDNFLGCTIIDGSISIFEHSFNGFQHVYENFSIGPLYPKMHPDRLEVFSTLKEVTGFINIQGFHEDFRNLSYFRNLEIIGGRTLTEYFALYIVKTSLIFLGLESLKKISAGSIAILENKELCFAESINWTSIKKAEGHRVLITQNRNESECVAKGLVCDEQCSSEGCWGPGPNRCISCKNFKSGNKCVKDCHSIEGMYTAEPNLCKPCHKECASCKGPGNGNCTACKHVRDGPICYASCPKTKYSDHGECKPCHPNCVDGCSGPANTIGEGGCKSCDKAITNDMVTVESCLPKDESCPLGYYSEYVGPQYGSPFTALVGKAICRKCHPTCKRCTSYGNHEQVCQECMNYKRGKHCEDECPQDHYADETMKACVPCSVECRGCYGPEASHCYKCRNFRIYPDYSGPPNNDTAFNCTAVCPSNAPFKIYQEDNTEPYCSPVAVGPVSKYVDNAQWIGLVTAIGVLILVVLLCIFFYRWQRKVKAEDEKVKIARILTGTDDIEPLRPSNVKPNFAKLRILKEPEIRRGGILGCGAFGTVYKGLWIPEGENVKIPIAIKVLREGTSANANKFLEEAYIMASVEHPNLLRLLAVCMTSQMMLVTQLMPQGCLLEYVRKNREKIGSKPLLNWCTQIARGMAYLEDKRLVHRDLAARNILLQTPYCVKITDFGLARLLDINEEVYKAGEEKLPIKWLALESIQDLYFTHKSDVWAFGVTVWELLTYGGCPYENVPLGDVPELLKKGERLPQPHICTIEVYMVMLKCWMLEANARPSFKELVDDFAEMARDPGRYLIIQGDEFMKLPFYTTQQQKKDIMDILSTGTGEDPEIIAEADEYLQSQLQKAVKLSDHQGPYVSQKSFEEKFVPEYSNDIDKLQRGVTTWEERNGYMIMSPKQTETPTSGDMAGSNKSADEMDLRSGDFCRPHPPVVESGVTTLEERDGYMIMSPKQTETPTSGDMAGSNKSADEMDLRSGDFCRPHPPVVESGVTTLEERDGYLIMSPKQTETPTSGDMGESNKSADEMDLRSGDFCRPHPPVVVGKSITCVDNAEYVINSDQSEGDIGIPVVGTTGALVDLNVVVSLLLNTPRTCVANESSEEEFVQEYSDDIDKLQSGGTTPEEIDDGLRCPPNSPI